MMFQLLKAGSVLKKHGGGRRTSDEIVANVKAAYERSSRKSLRRASRELQVPKSILQQIVHKCLKLYAYKVQLMQCLEPDDKPKRVEFANTISFSGATSKIKWAIFTEDQKDSSAELAFKYAVYRINKDKHLLPRTTLVYDIQYVPRDDSFHASKKVAMTASILPAVLFLISLQRDVIDATGPPMKGLDRPAGCWLHAHMPKPRWTIIQPEWRYRVVSTMIPPAVIAGIRNRISIPIVAPQVHHDAGWAPVPYTGIIIVSCYKLYSLQGSNDRACFSWPPRSPDLTPCDFYLLGFIKDRVYVPPLPADLPDLRQRLEAVVAAITPDTLIEVWEELAYRLDVCSH
ncbi:hypothetical protein ANN_03592 [Periplaneta americana]|uniref:Uncharacterized protein n=1 Tax=Periplaneta americana TaxID=6978 RepID=A0ABQ8U176_PERAM|nr:hypothetical protein ANN_03592 [Periplaneta americana]